MFDYGVKDKCVWVVFVSGSFETSAGLDTYIYMDEGKGEDLFFHLPEGGRRRGILILLC